MLSEHLTFIHDPGHGWLVVPLSELDLLNIRQEITPYSFIVGELGYLEEDQDYGTYINAREQQGYPDPEIHSQYTSHFSRSKRRF